MKRFILIIATLAALLCLSACNKAEKSFCGVWSYSEGTMYVDYYFCSLKIDKNGQVNFNQSKSDKYGLDDVYCYGTWSLVNDEQINCYMTYEDGDRETWTFRLTAPNSLYWVGESITLRQH